MVNKVEDIYHPKYLQSIHFSAKILVYILKISVFAGLVNKLYFYYQSNFSSFAHFKNVWWVVPSRAAAFRADISLLIQLW